LYFRAREEIILSSSCIPTLSTWQIDRAYGRNIINDVDFIEPDKGVAQFAAEDGCVRWRRGSRLRRVNGDDWQAIIRQHG